jgi:hypothetical protein
MRLDDDTEIGALLQRDPQVADILGWYSIEVDRLEPHTTLGEVCRTYRLDVDDLITDLAAVIDDDDDDDDDDYEQGVEYVDWGD